MNSDLATLEQLRHRRPKTPTELHGWIAGYVRIHVAQQAVCDGHSSPFAAVSQQFLERPRQSLWVAPRGSGKSYLSALETHLSSRFDPRHGTRILGGSKAQSAQIYEALQEIVIDGRGEYGADSDQIHSLLAESARYRNGSKVSILAASPRSVRGPHVQSLKLDEVDEIERKVFDAALGMAMEKHGVKTSVLMTSTWHNPGGPVSSLIEKARDGKFPLHTWCAFEVLERCPDERSGPALERCGDCALKPWCHADLGSHPSGLPKAKRSDGHYTIDSLIQKAELVSERVFKSDYLCQGPQVEGVWFSKFDEARHVTADAEFDSSLPVHISVDSGVWTGAVFLQIHPEHRDVRASVTIFDEYLSYDVGAERAARDILAIRDHRCGSAVCRVSTDSAGGAKNPSGITTVAEYQRCGLVGERGVEFWPKYAGSVIDSLRLTEGFIESADGAIHLRIHPRCRKTIEAFQGYRRKLQSGQWMEVPEDPQHPHEDLIDAIRGALKLEFPEGRMPQPKLQYKNARQVF